MYISAPFLVTTTALVSNTWDIPGTVSGFVGFSDKEHSVLWGKRLLVITLCAGDSGMQ